MRTVYAIDNLGYFTGHTMQLGPREGRGPNWVPAPPPEGEHVRWTGFQNGWVVDAERIELLGP